MLKPVLLACSLVALVSFAGCGEGDAPVPQQSDELYEVRAGTIRAAKVVMDGATHQLEQDGIVIALLRPVAANVDLAAFLGRDAQVEGIVRIAGGGAGHTELMEVVAIRPLDGATETVTYQPFEDTTFGYSLKYPSLFAKRETRSGSTYEIAGKKVVEISTVTNRTEKELASFLVDHYGYAPSDLTRVAVGSLPGYQFQNATGAVIYLARGPVVYAIAWFDSDTANRERNRRLYLEMVQSFQPTAGQAIDAPTVTPTGGSVAGLGEFCGGIAGVGCATGLSCQLDGATHPDAGGVCIEARGGAIAGVATTASQVAANADLQAVSADEVARGWYYGDRDAKRPNTPDTWVLTDSGTRFAMWRRPTIEPEHTPTVINPTTTRDKLSANQQAVIDDLKGRIGTLAPEAPREGKWALTQAAFADPSYVYATYRAGDAYRRLLFVYTVTSGKASFETKAYFRANATGAWVTTEGVDTAAGKALAIVDATAVTTKAAVSGYQLYTNQTAGYQLSYPQSWYWQHATRSRVEFSDTPFPRGDVRITAEIVSGAEFDFNEVQPAGSGVVVYLPLTKTTSLKISGDKKYSEQIGVMAQTYQQTTKQ